MTIKCWLNGGRCIDPLGHCASPRMCAKNDTVAVRPDDPMFTHAASLPAAPVEAVVPSDWRIDTSTGRDILLYKDCSVIEGETARYVMALLASPPAGQNADEIEHLRSAAQQARTALSSLIASGDRVVYSDALRALDEALKNVHPTERSGKFPVRGR